MNPVQLAGVGLGAGHVPDKKEILEGVYRWAHCGMQDTVSNTRYQHVTTE